VNAGASASKEREYGGCGELHGPGNRPARPLGRSDLVLRTPIIGHKDGAVHGGEQTAAGGVLPPAAVGQAPDYGNFT
jgi:hypothetical protein